jgi:hypothetical protein
MDIRSPTHSAVTQPEVTTFSAVVHIDTRVKRHVSSSPQAPVRLADTVQVDEEPVTSSTWAIERRPRRPLAYSNDDYSLAR